MIKNPHDKINELLDDYDFGELRREPMVAILKMHIRAWMEDAMQREYDIISRGNGFDEAWRLRREYFDNVFPLTAY